MRGICPAVLGEIPPKSMRGTGDRVMGHGMLRIHWMCFPRGAAFLAKSLFGCLRDEHGSRWHIHCTHPIAR